MLVGKKPDLSGGLLMNFSGIGKFFMNLGLVWIVCWEGRGKGEHGEYEGERGLVVVLLSS
jgi:hypothetical protein